MTGIVAPYETGPRCYRLSGRLSDLGRCRFSYSMTHGGVHYMNNKFQIDSYTETYLQIRAREPLFFWLATKG